MDFLFNYHCHLDFIKREGAKSAAWILPLIVLAYAVDNQFTGKSPSSPPDYQLFPTEEKIVQHYLMNLFPHQCLNKKNN